MIFSVYLCFASCRTQKRKLIPPPKPWKLNAHFKMIERIVKGQWCQKKETSSTQKQTFNMYFILRGEQGRERINGPINGFPLKSGIFSGLQNRVRAQ